MPGMNTTAPTNIKLPLAFIFCGLFSFVAAQFILLTHYDAFVQHTYRIPPIWMGAHLLLLGFVVMVIMGAMYQLVPVAFLTPIWSQKFAYFQFAVTAIGIILFALLLGYNPAHSIYGAVLAVIGLFMFIIQMLLTIAKQKDKNMITIFVSSALICLLATIAAGFLLAWNISFDVILEHAALLKTHLLFGITGWFTLLIFGFSYKLIPMFSLSHGFTMKAAKPAFLIYSIGLLTIMISIWTNSLVFDVLGFALLFGGFTCFILDVKEILQKRMRRKLDKPLSFAIVAIGIGYIVHLTALILSIISVQKVSVWGMLIFTYLFGWVIFSILGYLYKIVPFLWWTHKYSKQIGKENVPTLAQMVNEKWSFILYVLFTISLIGILLGVSIGAGIIVLIFLCLLFFATVGYVISIIRILFV